MIGQSYQKVGFLIQRLVQFVTSFYSYFTIVITLTKLISGKKTEMAQHKNSRRTILLGVDASEHSERALNCK